MFKGQAEDPSKGLNVFEVDKEYEGPLHSLRVTTNYDPKSGKGDERFIETVVGYAAPKPGDPKQPGLPHGMKPTTNVQIGDQILNSAPASRGYIGWVATKDGEFQYAGWQPYGQID